MEGGEARLESAAAMWGVRWDLRSKTQVQTPNLGHPRSYDAEDLHGGVDVAKRKRFMR